jgi:hypothetical protein
MKTTLSSLIVCAAGMALMGLANGGCNGNPSVGSPAYKEGRLGNGSFLFRCDDSVACDRWSTGDAKDFPDLIATGANFNLRFVADGQEGTITIAGTRYDGVTIEPVSPYVGRGPLGFASLKPGFATVIARDAKGYVIDYVTLNIVKPDSLVVYSAEYKGSSPVPVEKMTFTTSATSSSSSSSSSTGGTPITSGSRKSFRTVGQVSLRAIAGSIQVKWESADPTIADVESYSGGVATVIGKKVGTTKLKAIAGGLEKNIDVEVTQ